MKNIILITLFLSIVSPILAQTFESDPSKKYTMPALDETPNGRLYMSWIEKDEKGLSSFCMSFADENSQNFNKKNVIVSGYGVSSSRLMPAKLLAKKNGTLVAVLIYNPTAGPESVGRRSSGGKLVYTTSTDSGNSWSEPKAVDNDPTPGFRGFYDAIILSNDEIAVAYLKDVKNSTKREERDLRLAITKNGDFQNEELIDAVVCDCCNISLLVDNKDYLNIYYRDNNEDVRDIAHKVSKDNGATFSDSKILYPDNWYIQGCPHNGSVSASMGTENLITWYSAGDNEPGIRLVKENGEKLAILTNDSAQNSRVVADENKAVFYWQELNKETDQSMLAYSVITKGGVSERKWLDSKGEASNGNAKIINGQLLVAFEAENQGIGLLIENLK
jgi:hypothetical protein